jgi:phytoene/squalene synthetase
MIEDEITSASLLHLEALKRTIYEVFDSIVQELKSPDLPPALRKAWLRKLRKIIQKPEDPRVMEQLDELWKREEEP